MRLFNSLSRTTQDFTPLNPPNVGMYTCGPTVYDYMHIGNLRTFIFSDLLFRVLKLNNYSVRTVQNITDVDDKIIKKAKEKNVSIPELTDEYTKAFLEDLQKLNIYPSDENPKATEHIGKMVQFIEKLVEKGVAYVEEDGSVYFDISKFDDYGKLSGLDKRDLKTGTRILSDEYSKDDVQDFALWKSVEGDEVGWDSPWGKGRPGWHIECSVMSEEYLGESFDLHLGGIDLMFPHHENEIAQSEAKTGKQFVKYFVHGEHILVEGQKMSKSLNNFFTLKDLEKRGIEPLALRYLYLTAHYRDKLNFTWDALQGAQNALNNLREEIREWDLGGEVISDFDSRFKEALNNDLNAPQALALMWEMVKSSNPTADKAVTLLKFDEVLGFELDEYIGKKVEVSDEVRDLVNQREEARKGGDYQKSDEVRDQIRKLGFEVDDTPSGPKLKKVVH
jgi:cysteinyl-tRNA synthetase